MKLDAYDIGLSFAESESPPIGVSSVPPALRHIARTRADIPRSPEADAFGAMLRAFLRQNAINNVRAVAHRIVHGGTSFSTSCVIDDVAEHTLKALIELAPLHMPIALDWIALCRAVFGPLVVQIGVFDTAFFADLPPVARHYAMPLELQQTYGVRRFGFHGLAHASMMERIQNHRPDLDRGGRIISIQLGGGCSMAAIDRGVPVDTSMGFSPLEGLVMATRAGDIDAAVLTFLQRKGGYSAESVERLLNNDSGLFGLSGLSGDMRVLLKSRGRSAELAIDLYCYRVRKYIGSYAAAMGGVDVVTIGGGVGEHSPEIRARILGDMDWCGIVLDRDSNDAFHGVEDVDARISAATGNVDVWVVAVDEAAVMAHQASVVLEYI